MPRNGTTRQEIRRKWLSRQLWGPCIWLFLFSFLFFFFSNTTLCIHCCMHFTQKKSRSKLKWIKQSVFHNCITRHNCERGMEESKSGLSVWQSSLSVWLSPSVVFLSAVKFVYLAFYSFCVSALICLSNCLLCLYINIWSVFLSTSLACLWVVYLYCICCSTTQFLCHSYAILVCEWSIYLMLFFPILCFFNRMTLQANMLKKVKKRNLLWMRLLKKTNSIQFNFDYGCRLENDL